MFHKHRAFFDTVILASLFAPAFLFIKVAVQEIGPSSVIALRIAIAAILLFLVLKIKKTRIPKSFNLWKHCFILGFFLNGFPFLCYSYSLTLIPISLSALINGTTPVLTVLLANLLLEDERLSINRLLAVILGMAGFFILFLPNLFKYEFNADTLGILLCFLGACSYAIGAVYARKYLPKAPALVSPTLQLLTSLIYLIPFALIVEDPKLLLEVSPMAWAAVLGVSVISTMLAFIMYHQIIVRHGATILSMSMFLLPLFGTFLGIVFFNETITMNFVIAGLLILSGVAVINNMIPLPFVKKQPV